MDVWARAAEGGSRRNKEEEGALFVNSDGGDICGADRETTQTQTAVTARGVGEKKERERMGPRQAESGRREGMRLQSRHTLYVLHHTIRTNIRTKLN